MTFRLSDFFGSMWSIFLIGLWISASWTLPLDLESRMNDLEKKFEQQQLENRQLEEEVTALRKNDHLLSHHPALLQGTEGVNSHKINRRLLQQEPPIAEIGFYAYMSSDEPDPRGHHTLVYDTVQTNLGNGYNRNTGVFTAPRSDLYSFTWSTRVACHLAHTTELIMNNRIMGSTYAYCGYNTVTGHVVATVTQGDVIFVRTHSTSPGQGAIKSDEFGRSAFSGFLIH